MEERGQACVIGGQGALGGLVVASLCSAGWSVHPAGRRPDRREGFRQVDLARPDSFGPALGEVNLVVSTVADPALAAERWVMERGGLLVNCSHAPGASAAALSAEIGDRCKGTVLLNAGLVPGIANLIAAELLDRHPDADTLEVAFTVLKQATAGRGGGAFVFSGLTARSHHRVVRLPFPDPFGDLPCIEIYEGEDCGFAGVAGERRVRNYLAFGDRAAASPLRVANALRLMQVLPKAAFAVAGGGAEQPSREPTAIWIGARKGAELLAASVAECEGDYRTTARAARMFGEALVASRRPGCFNPEDVFDVDDFAMPMKEMGVRRCDHRM